MTENYCENKPPENKQLLEKSIIDEGQRLLKEEPDKWPGFLNNFYSLVLPENNRLWVTKREGLKKIDFWDKKHRDTTDHPEEHSGLWLDQTPGEFFETIDRVIAELDDDKKISSAIEKLCNVKDYRERTEAQDELEEKLIPVFARLVAMGYTRHELTG